MSDTGSQQYGFDSCGALDLSSAASSGCPSTKVSDEETSDTGESGGKRSSEEGETSAGEFSQRKRMRRNIREVLAEDRLDVITREARAAEEQRLQRLKQQPAGRDDPMALSDDSDECRIMSDTLDDEEEEEEDPNNSGMHVNDALNTRHSDGSVLVNVNHSKTDPDIFLAPQLAAAIKPHQIGGVRFLYDNIVESVSRFSTSQGYGCILAHNMGLGKTMQVISFVDILLSHTVARSVLCIVPINTIQNWMAEFNYWLPEEEEGTEEKPEKKIKYRNFSIYVLNDTYKNLNQRASVISEWGKTGGVLMMGYELYRQLANRKPRRKRSKLEPRQEEKENKVERKILSDIQSHLVNPGPDLVICDEGHRIKNSHASISQALKQIRTRRRIVLTGYPLQNNLMEYWCMVDWVRPNFLGNKTEFSNMFERPIQNGQCSDSTPKDVTLMKHRAHVLHQQLKGFVQRRGHIVLKDSLPAKTEHVLFVRMTPIQRRLYRRFMEELITNRCVSNPLRAFAVCCKIWNHPDVLHNYLLKREEDDLDLLEAVAECDTSPAPLEATSGSQSQPQFVKKEEINYEWAAGMFSGYKAGLQENSNKLVLLLGILEESLKCDDRVLLFSQSLFTLNLIEEFLGAHRPSSLEEGWVAGETYYRLDGSTSAMERERLINSFNTSPRVKLFLVSTRAGSLGVNLVGANRVVIFDASWNPCHDTQAVCRVYRYGQSKETHVYRLVTDNSLEKKIYDRQVNKQGMADRIVDEMNPDAHLSTRDVHSLICEEEEDTSSGEEVRAAAETFSDPVMRSLVMRHGDKLTKPPFAHESLLVDRKDNKLSRAEKQMAEKAYKLERTSKITYSRPSYAAFYPKQGTFATNLNNPGSNGFTRNRYYEHGRKLDTWTRDKGPSDPHHVETAFPVPSFSNVLGPAPVALSDSGTNEWKQREPGTVSQEPKVSHIQQLVSTSAVTPVPGDRQSSSGSEKSAASGLNTGQALEALSKQGVQLQQVLVPRDLSIPTGPSSAPVHLVAGDKVMVIRTVKGIYLRMGEKIIKIKQPQAVQGLFGENVNC